MKRIFAAALALALADASEASAQQPPAKFCGGFGGSGAPVIKPVISPTLTFDRSDAGFDCQAWQAFIYLNWPASNVLGARGAPNKSAKFGAPGATVWETYKTTDRTFLPGAKNPGPWNDPIVVVGGGVPKTLLARVNAGQVRTLSRTSKVSREIVANLASAQIDPATLSSITQAGGGTLYDQKSVPVYYEIAMNQDQYDFIWKNDLFDANKQLDYARKTTIALPGGATSYGKIGALELKAAWKVLTPAEIKSGRFHTAQALLTGSKTPVTVGLVGLHFFQMLNESAQGMWATFAQEDNAPLLDQQPQAAARGGKSYTFFNPACPSPCPINNWSTNPTQVVQIFKDEATLSNTNMKKMLQAYGAGPWQYYKLVSVQWPKTPKLLSSLPAPVNQPLPNGDPNTDTLTNAVLETFQQSQGTGCLACHVYSNVSTNQALKIKPPPQNAASYSFMFGYAHAPGAPSKP